MDDEPPSEVLPALPRSRPHRRSQKRPRTQSSGPTGKPPRPSGTGSPDRPDDSERAPRGSAEAADKPKRLSHPAQPDGVPPTPSTRKPVPASGTEILATAVQATAELAEIGLTASARVLRNAVSRLTRP